MFAVFCFQADTCRSGPGTITATCTNPSGHVLDIMVLKTDDDKFDIPFNPHEKGKIFPSIPTKKVRHSLQSPRKRYNLQRYCQLAKQIHGQLETCSEETGILRETISGNNRINGSVKLQQKKKSASTTSSHKDLSMNLEFVKPSTPPLDHSAIAFRCETYDIY